MSDNIPAGYVFAPTDQELLLCYLLNKEDGNPLPCNKAVTECDLYGTREPWEMFKDSMEDVVGYFFTKLEKKSAKGSRVRRTVGKGSWKAQKKAVPIHGEGGKIIGSKKAFVYEAKASENTPRCIMHEYQLPDVSQQSNEAKGSRQNDYVLCRIRIKKGLRTTEANSRQQQGNDMPNPCDALPEPPLASQPLSPKIKEIKSAEAHHLCPTAANLQQQQGNGMPIDIGTLPEPPLPSQPLSPEIKAVKSAEAHHLCPTAANLQQQQGNGMPIDIGALPEPPLPSQPFSLGTIEWFDTEPYRPCVSAANLQQQEGNGMPIDIGALPESPLAPQPHSPGTIYWIQTDPHCPCESAANLQQQEGNGMTTNPADAFPGIDDCDYVMLFNGM